jgi:hypothetical protein
MHWADVNIGPELLPPGAKDANAEDEEGEEPLAISPPADSSSDISFTYDPADPAFLKDTRRGLQEMKDQDAYSILLGLAQVSQRESEWKGHLIIAAKRSADTMNMKVFTNNRSTRAQDYAQRDITKWVTCVS